MLASAKTYFISTAGKAGSGFIRGLVLLVLGAWFLCVTPAVFGQTDPNSPTTLWVPILYGNNNFPDPSADQQTGSPESDIVGNLSQPSLYMQYANGWLGFRFRIGADKNPPGFNGAAFVGLDANLNGSLDLFIGVNNSGSANQVGIWYAGAGLNTSPNTTTIVTPAQTSDSETALNYGFAPVTAVNDPGALSFDLNGDGKTDQFLTFFVPFSAIISPLAVQGIVFSLNSPMQMVAATATQANSLNQDLNGVNGGINSSLSWQQLGATSQTYLPTGITPVPEPSALALLGVAGSLSLLVFARQKRRA
ncbi:MAG: PEP-CTERM sorting domain-containing protein [Verrucomicrobiales bacterium]|nr:PEP-CTERM sorting domain-containing protein [Verrucomicrobiales bacterium]